jgi:hypothetical protein
MLREIVWFINPITDVRGRGDKGRNVTLIYLMPPVPTVSAKAPSPKITPVGFMAPPITIFTAQRLVPVSYSCSVRCEKNRLRNVLSEYHKEPSITRLKPMTVNISKNLSHLPISTKKFFYVIIRNFTRKIRDGNYLVYCFSFHKMAKNSL